MATKINAAGDAIKVDKTFVSGKDRVTVNGTVVFEGKLQDGEAEKVVAGDREYVILKRVTSRLAELFSIELEVHEGGKLIHSGIYDKFGKSHANQADAKSSAAVTACGVVGAIIGFTVMMTLNMTTGVVPGGAIGGGIGGGVGGALGGLIGKALFGPKS